ncbi:GIY-YIG nuclease family protein [Maridesulfovibrio zosterae]|uniref:GIY-YIG nuclease family protein n=1 Tax=Maridesulfovibrio zosterae TaxID=82171 RepID=UPI000404B500|nr:GIY-YIG nuclease family protein [Maridesulfovibrio zosterae]
MNTWYVYLLRCKDNSLYCGVTTDPARRLEEHNSGTGAKYTRARLPVTMETFEKFPDKRSAYRAEYAVKQKRAAQKINFLKELAAQENNLD